MEITRSNIETTKGPVDWFTGDVYLDAVAAPREGSTVAAALVHFTPGARTAWHTHPHGQTIFVTEGVGRCQREGGPVETIRPGDRVFFEPGERHWHGAAPDRLMVHVAIQRADASRATVAWADPQRSRPRTSSAVISPANRLPSSITPLKSAALRCASASTFASIVSSEIIR